ncbi:hypothetical protein [Sphingomonas koreensis]|uniref:hypothetical protein n=1 Tax=Sphingomonas koreensis TaxID=93064 RepID=UPI00234E3C49|nr:hypothetical protein [Sphingomonas koreensis]MDC7812840.1 hypothetical protein [Sphingomonas koreensis]
MMNATGIWPTFIHPVFSSVGAGNGLFLQVIGIDGRLRGVIDYLPAPDSPFQTLDEEHIVEEGEHALYGFALSEQDSLIGTRDEIAPQLAQLIDDPRLRARPLLRLDAVEFAQRWDRLADAASHALHLLGQVSPRGAERWRDGVFLTRQLRLAVARVLGWTRDPLSYYDQLNSVFLTRSGGGPMVEIGAELRTDLEQLGSWQAMVRASVAQFLDVFQMRADELAFQFVASVTTETPVAQISWSSQTLEKASWLICPFGRRAQKAMRGRELSTRSDMLVIDPEEPRVFQRLAEVLAGRRIDVAFVCDMDDQSQAAAVAANRTAAEHFPVTLGLILGAQTAKRPSAYWPAWLDHFQRRHIIVDGHAELFGPRSRYPLARLVRTWLDHIHAPDIPNKEPWEKGSWAAFSLGSQPGGVASAPRALRQAVASLANLHFSARSARSADAQFASVGRLAPQAREELKKSLVGMLEIDKVDIGWRQIRIQPHAVPVQASLLVHGIEFDENKPSIKAVSEATEIVLRAAGFEIERRDYHDDAITLRVGGATPFEVIAAPAYSEDIGPASSNSIVSVGSSKVRSSFAVFLGEEHPVLRFDELAFLQGSDNPVGLARYMASTLGSPAELTERHHVQIEADILNAVLTHPERYDLYQPLQDLSRNTRIEGADISIERVTRQPGYRLRFEGSLQLAVELNYGNGDVDVSDYYPGTFLYEIDPDGGRLVKASADTSSFYE